MNKKERETDEVVREFYEKYNSLVWFARSAPPDHPNHHPAAVKGQMEVQDKYPKEAAQLTTEEGDWHHGFNSGVSAAMWLLSEVREGHAEQAKAEFPSIDT